MILQKCANNECDKYFEKRLKQKQQMCCCSQCWNRYSYCRDSLHRKELRKKYQAFRETRQKEFHQSFLTICQKTPTINSS